MGGPLNTLGGTINLRDARDRFSFGIVGDYLPSEFLPGLDLCSEVSKARDIDRLIIQQGSD